jgi:hypothetical protein
MSPATPKTRRKAPPPKSNVVNGPPWPWDTRSKLRRREAAAYLREVHALPHGLKHLENLACKGEGPEFRYSGSIPIYDTADLDKYALGRLGEKRHSTRRRSSTSAQVGSDAAPPTGSVPAPANITTNETRHQSANRRRSQRDAREAQRRSSRAGVSTPYS